MGWRALVRLVMEDRDTVGCQILWYLLHGMSDDHTVWMRRTSLERYADGLRLMIVMPDGGLNWYVNDDRRFGLAYEDFIVEDVVGAVERTFPAVRGRKGRAIAGLSMGGFGAMVLGLRHPDLFRAAVSHSGALEFTHRRFEERSDLNLFADSLPSGAYDCFALAQSLKASGRDLAIRFDCGVDDFLIQQNRAFHAHLSQIGVPHEYEEHAGAHDWPYWDLHIRDTLRFVMARFEGLPAGGRR